MKKMLLPIAFSIALTSVARADAPPVVRAEPSHFHADMEVDPTAYILDGYSLHVGLGWKRLRVDLGAFAIAVPEAIHGNEGFSSSFDGFGAKLQLFPFGEQRGGFVGIGVAAARVLVQRDG